MIESSTDNHPLKKQLTEASLRLASVTHDSVVDGPGLRYTVFTQGCPRACKNCHNPETRDPLGGYETNAWEIFLDLKRNPLLDGITLSGGEPLDQAKSLAVLAQAVKSLGLGVWVYTGYMYEECLKLTAVPTLLQYTDMLVDGPFIEELKSYSLPYRGSTNQRLIALNQGSPVPPVESVSSST
jgi:anaerobic ribonucleoside-triphosphate reductase activating protein